MYQTIISKYSAKERDGMAEMLAEVVMGLSLIHILREEDGKWFNCYLVYKDTSKMDTKEFSHLIDGAIDEAKALGIETDTPEQLARYKEEWSR